MPAVLQFNKPAIIDIIEQAANYLNISDGFDGFCTYVDDLNYSLKIPKSYQALALKIRTSNVLFLVH